MRFIAELRRRNVIRMAGLYLVAAWLVTQVASTLLPAFEAPPWALRLVIIVLAIGVVPMLAFSWIFELTPEGLRRDEGPAVIEPAAPRTARRLDRAIIAVLICALTYFAIDKFALAPRRAETPAEAPPRKSIAVLPFENLSTDPDNAYFAVGMQDMVLTKLAAVRDLKVLSRTSTEKLGSRPDDLAAIALRLGVANFLEGSVQKSGKDVLINVQLIDAASGGHLWAEAYQRTLDNVFGVEGEVAQNVADALHAALTRTERATLMKKATENPAALDEYLRALALERSATTESFPAIDAALHRAVALDPGFTLAWVAMTFEYAQRAWFGADPSPTLVADANAALAHATALDPEMPQVRLAEAALAYYANRDFEGAHAKLVGVLHDLPNEPRAWSLGSAVSRRLGLWEDASEDLRHALLLDPANQRITYEEVLTQIARGRYDDATTALDATPDLDRTFAPFIELSLFAALNRGGMTAADGLLASVPAESQALPMIVGTRAWLAAARNDDRAAEKLYADAIAHGGDARSEFLFAGYIPAAAGWRLERAAAEQRLGAGDTARALYASVKADADAALATPSSAHVNVIAAWHAARARANAGLGNAADALADITQATTLVPESKDQFEGPYWSSERARVYAVTGDTESAIALLGDLVGKPASFVTPVTLRLDPIWMPLRGNARFEVLSSNR